MPTTVTITKRGAERARARHCWIYRSDVTETGGARPGEVTRVSFVASKRSVGGAVQRNRARRRLREIVRRRWLRVPSAGYLLMFVAMRGVLTAPHQELASDVERVLAAAGALAPISTDEA